MPQYLQCSGFGAILVRKARVLPAPNQRERHQNAFGGSAGLQAKGCSTIVDKIELHVAPPAYLLPMLLKIGVGHVFPSLNDRHVRRHERSGAAGNELE